MDTHARLLHDLHTAYENHAPDEARRLLRLNRQKINCSALLRCGDEDYIRWLLTHDILPLPTGATETWPELQEIQLQCNALNEAQRPGCILKGELKPKNTTGQDE